MRSILKQALLSVMAILLFSSLALADTTIITKSKTISVAPTVDTNAYTSGDLVGPKQTLTSAGVAGVYTGTIQSVVITDLESQNADFDLVIFSSDPSGTTFTDNAAFDIADADLPKVICVIQVTTNVAFADNGVVIANGNNCVFDAIASTGTIYAAAVIRSAATFTASGLTFRYSILQD
jgi:hypothetical protein